MHIVVSFYNMCTISLYRTDSALKFGWFFVSYMASLYIFSLLIYSTLILLSAHLLFPISTSSCTLAFAFLLQLLHPLSLKENLSREFLLTLHFMFLSWKLILLLWLIFNWFDLPEARKTLGIAEGFCDWTYWFSIGEWINY